MAQEIADSKLLDTWSSSGTKIEPDISKIIEGWQLGEQPPHEYMNWLQNTFGSKLNHILKNGIAKWNNETEYLAGSSVQHSGSIWLCKTTNTNSEPTGLNANWEKLAISKDLTVTVDTLANLKSISYPANTVWVSGYHAKNDGAFGSHIFRLKGVKTTETDNGGTVIIATIGGTDYVYELQYDGAVNVKWFGAKGDGVTNDAVAINAAMEFSRDVLVPTGLYIIKARLIMRHNAQILRGEGIFNSIIRGASGAFDILEIGGGGFVSGCVIQDMQLDQSSATGGHTILQSVGTSKMVFDRIILRQANPAGSYYHKLNNLNYIDNHWTNFSFFHLESATVPGFSLRDTSGGVVNSNSWKNGVVTYSGNYAFLIESGSNETYQFDNVFSGINFEVCSGGAIKGLGVQALTIENSWLYDTPLVKRDVVYIGASTNASPLTSKFNRIDGMHRRSSTLDTGILDVRLQAGGCVGTTLIGNNSGTAEGYTVSLGGNVANTLIGTKSWTISDISTSTLILKAESGETKIEMGANVSYGVDPSNVNTAYIEGPNGVATEGPLKIGNTSAHFLVPSFGSPEGVVAANIGSIYIRLDGGGLPVLYVKSAGGFSNTGWVAK